MATMNGGSPRTYRIKPCYNENVDRIRYDEYPMLKDTFYLDHAGTTPYPQSLIEQSSRDLMQNLYGNPHSGSASSQLSTRRVEDVRLRALRLFQADPDDFDLVFVANATAGIKLVMEGFRELQGGFWYGYHQDSHTSLVGVREIACEHCCFGGDEEVEKWLEAQPRSVFDSSNERGGLFAYPAQSNLNGRRLPLSWPGRLRSSQYPPNDKIYSLLDAAAFVSTSPLDFSDASQAPDFTVLSFYKMFGFPDLGALIVRKDSSWPLVHRKYFGGGTVEMVTCMNESWHMRKQDNLHEQLEDGTLPFHSIIALDSAFDVHEKLFGSLERISSHTSFLADRLYKDLSSLRHANGRTVCKIHKDPRSSYRDSLLQGPIVALNLQSSRVECISNAEVEKLAAIRNIQVRTGGLCNPGGVASCLELTAWDMKRNFAAGHRCGNDNDLIGGKPTGIIRVSLGATSNIQDIEAFVQFLREFFVDDCCYPESKTENPKADTSFYIESLSVYPIKSCGPWQVPSSMAWDVRPEGLAWDREWCLVHQGTRAALSQKRIPRMALIRPHLDFEHGVLRIRYAGRLPLSLPDEITVPLSADHEQPQKPCAQHTKMCYSSPVCGDSVSAYTYNDPDIAAFFTAVLSTPCTLARFPPGPQSTTRHSKLQIQHHPASSARTRPPSSQQTIPGAFPTPPPSPPAEPPPILLSNESPILTISRASLTHLNELIVQNNKPNTNPTNPIPAAAFRANIILAPFPSNPSPSSTAAYDEDNWTRLRIQHNTLEPEQPTTTTTTDLNVLAPCRRCQMVCIDQNTAERTREPFSTLAKTRRRGIGEGGVFFGVHCALDVGGNGSGGRRRIRVGDVVVPVRKEGVVVEEEEEAG